MMFKTFNLAAAFFALVGNASALRAVTSNMAQLPQEEQQAFDMENPEHVRLLQENIESKLAFALDMHGIPSSLMQQTPSLFDPALIEEYQQKQLDSADRENRDLQDGAIDPFSIIVPILAILNAVDTCGIFNTLVQLISFVPSKLLTFLCPDPIPGIGGLLGGGGGGLFGCDYEDAFKYADLICTTILGLTDTVIEALLAIFNPVPREASCSELCTNYYLLVCSSCETDPVDPYAAT